MKNLVIVTLISALSMQSLLAGSGSSTMQEEEESAPARKATPAKSTLESPDFKTIATGAAVLGGALLAAYEVYNSFSSEEKDKSPPVKSKGFDSKADSYVYPKQSYQQNDDIDSYKRQVSPSSIIDLSVYADTWSYESAKVDLHPVYNNNPRKHLRDRIFVLQRDYHLGQSSEDMVRIITGTGKKRPGPNFTLQNNVETWLQEDFIQKRIKRYWQPQEGIFSVLLKKDIY